MPYASITRLAARTALAQRLADTGMVRWIAAELNGYLTEALRTWNAYVGAYRQRGAFQTDAQVPWYDLSTTIAGLRGYTVTDYDLITDIQYALLEPPTPAAWSGTDQFTLADILGAIQRRRDQFLRETGAVLTREEESITPVPAGRYVLPSNLIAVRRCAWRDATGLVTALRRDDEWGANHYAVQWQQQMRPTPIAYSVAVAPPVQLQILPPPQDTGSLDLLCVENGAALVAGTEAVLNVPDDWTWVIKWGALADLLGKDGLALDPGRAAYADARWAQGIAAATQASVVLSARINEVPCRVSGVSEADAYSPLWQSIPGTPRSVVTAGQNLFATWPPPSVVPAGGNYSITLDVVANMAVPTNDNEPLQIGAEMLDPILDYAQHLALFKEGPSQVQASQPLLDRFLRACGVTWRMQQAQWPARTPLNGQTTEDTRALAAQADPVEANA